ncbi:MAG: SIMPL domain-containing protein [Burkholderiales bacterium]|nr:MAG: SIMPL domain-containing protein [Burkholderiales bacterium]
MVASAARMVNFLVDRLSRTLLRAAAALCGLLLATGALAGPTLSLGAEAQRMVANDQMTARLAIERDGPRVGTLNQEVLAALRAALDEARQVPGIEARLGSVWTSQRRGPRGELQGWRVRGEVVLSSQAMDALGALAGRLAERMQLAGVSFALSDAARAKVERELLNEAAGAFRQKASDAASAFGYAGYQIRELTLGQAPQLVPRSPALARMAVAEAAPVPSEGGESQVSVQVSGIVELE